MQGETPVFWNQGHITVDYSTGLGLQVAQQLASLGLVPAPPSRPAEGRPSARFRGCRRACRPRPRGGRRPPPRPARPRRPTWPAAAPVNAAAVGQRGRRARPASRPRRSSAGQAVEQVVAAGAACSRMARATATRVLLDRLVGRLPADAGAAPRPPAPWWWRGTAGSARARASIDRRVGAELVEHGEEGLEQAVGGEEGVGQGDPAHHRAAHVALVPLVAGQLGDHRQVAARARRRGR